MRTIKHSLYGTMLRLEDLKAGDVIMVHRRITSKSIPYWPFRVTRMMPENNANGFSCLPGEFLMPDGDFVPHRYAVAARVRKHEDEYYVIGKPMVKNWVKTELKKAVTKLDSLQQKVDWLKTLEK